MNLTLSEISDISKNESPVFLVGIPRSGTTLMYTMLLKHSAFKSQVVNESKKFLSTESRVFMNPQNVYSSQRANKYLLENQQVKQQFLDSIQTIRGYNQLCYYLYQPNLFSKTKVFNIGEILRFNVYKIGLNPLVMRSYFYHAKIARKVERILEKTPQHIARIAEIKETFPKAKYLFIYRHPIDVFSSFKKRLKKVREINPESDGPNWLKISPKRFSNLYENYINIAFQEKVNNPDNFKLIRYEEIVADINKMIFEICDFLEENFEETIIPVNENPKGSTFSEFLGGKIVASTKDWQEFLDHKDAEIVEHKLSKVMKELNYKKYTN